MCTAASHADIIQQTNLLSTQWQSDKGPYMQTISCALRDLQPSENIQQQYSVGQDLQLYKIKTATCDAASHADRMARNKPANSLWQFIARAYIWKQAAHCDICNHQKIFSSGIVPRHELIQTYQIQNMYCSKFSPTIQNQSSPQPLKVHSGSQIAQNAVRCELCNPQ
jgi:hypothetical protein